MKKLGKNLKRMLSGLAYQDAGDYLSMHEKMKVLGYDVDTDADQARRTEPHLSAVVRPVSSRRIALLSDGRGLAASLNYAIEACLRQEASLDLLLYGAIDMDCIVALEKMLSVAGIDYRRIQIGVNVIEYITDYIQQQPSLIYLVATPEDTVARVLAEDVMPKSLGRMRVPLVLIQDKEPGSKLSHISGCDLTSYGT